MEIKDELLDIEGIRSSNKSLLDLFIRRTAVLTSTQEQLCEKIIKDQWRNANRITQPDNNVSEIDFCNLGTFYISKSKAKKRVTRIEKYLSSGLGLAGEMDDKERNKKNAILLRNKEIIASIKFKTKQINSKYED